MPDFQYVDLLPRGEDQTEYRLLSTDGIEVVHLGGQQFLRVSEQALKDLTFAAMRDIQHRLRPGHLQQLRNILDDPQASPNDRFVALDLLREGARLLDIYMRRDEGVFKHSEYMLVFNALERTLDALEAVQPVIGGFDDPTPKRGRKWVHRPRNN